MTQIQKILAFASKKSTVSQGESVTVSQNTELSALSFSDRLCGVYGALYLENGTVTVPRGIFIDLQGALRDDISSRDVAEFLFSRLESKISPDISLEFGGDSMTYLNASDRTETVKRFIDTQKKPFSVTFECDYIAAEYTIEKFGKKPQAFYNDGPESYLEVIAVDLSEA